MTRRLVARLAPYGPVRHSRQPNARRDGAWRTLHAHGNFRGYEAACWRAQEAAELAEAAAALRADAERERWTPLFPSANVYGWLAEPVPSMVLAPCDGEQKRWTL